MLNCLTKWRNQPIIHTVWNCIKWSMWGIQGNSIFQALCYDSFLEWNIWIIYLRIKVIVKMFEKQWTFKKKKLKKSTFQELDVKRFNGRKIGGWYEKIMSVFTFIDSSMTGSVRSLVKNIFLTIFSPLGSIKSPTLSQLPAKCKGANISSFLTISFKFIPIALGVDDIFLKIILENIQLSQ